MFSLFIDFPGKYFLFLMQLLLLVMLLSLLSLIALLNKNNSNEINTFLSKNSRNGADKGNQVGHFWSHSSINKIKRKNITFDCVFVHASTSMVQ